MYEHVWTSFVYVFPYMFVHHFFYRKITFCCNRNNNSTVKTLKIIKGLIFAYYSFNEKKIWKNVKKLFKHNYA